VRLTAAPAAFFSAAGLLSRNDDPHAKRGPREITGHRVNNTITDDDVRMILYVRERYGWSPKRIAHEMPGVSVSAAAGVISCGTGARTVRP